MYILYLNQYSTYIYLNYIIKIAYYIDNVKIYYFLMYWDE